MLSEEKKFVVIQRYCINTNVKITNIIGINSYSNNDNIVSPRYSILLKHHRWMTFQLRQIPDRFFSPKRSLFSIEWFFSAVWRQRGRTERLIHFGRWISSQHVWTKRSKRRIKSTILNVLSFVKIDVTCWCLSHVFKRPLRYIVLLLGKNTIANVFLVKNISFSVTPYFGFYFVPSLKFID